MDAGGNQDSSRDRAEAPRRADGLRRSGKTTLLRRLFPRAGVVLLEDPDVRARARSDPRALLEELRLPVLFDEIQNVPELFGYIRTRIDRNPREMGRWLFTGSQGAPWMQGVSESMAGRAAILQLLPFSLAETDRVSLLLGALFEGYVAAEILKWQVNRGRRKELYHFRDQQGLEVDFLFPSGHGGLWMVECNASKTVQPAMAGPLGALRRSMGDRTPVRLTVVHRTSTPAPPTRALAPGVDALDVQSFAAALAGEPKRTAKGKARLVARLLPEGR